jgi:hypothetical protein
MTDYATDWSARQEMIWKAMTAVNSGMVKDPIKYVNRMAKKYGPVLKRAVGFAYATKGKHCYAVEVTKIDEALCAEFGWRTIADFRK